MRQFGPFLVIIAVFAFLGGCETTKYRYLPTAPDTIVVKDTVVVHPPCDDDRPPGWSRH